MPVVRAKTEGYSVERYYSDQKEKIMIFTKELGDIILDVLCSAPESQLSSELVKQSQDFKETSPSVQDIYNYLIEIAELPEEKCSRFITRLCNISPYYEKP
jgi:hypothetical protein